jgi:hypothetical protein
MSRRPLHLTLEQDALRPSKAVPGNTPGKRVARRPRLTLLPGGLDLAHLSPDARRFVDVLPSEGAVSLRTAALLSRLLADEVAVITALLSEAGWITQTVGERLTVALTPSAQAVRRRQPARCPLVREAVA